MSGIIDVPGQRLKAHSFSAGIFNVAVYLSTGRTSSVTYSGARRYLPSSFLIVQRNLPHAAFTDGHRCEFLVIAVGSILRAV
jgi:hypothetical protein